MKLPPRTEPSCPAWMMTFGDCMGLLLTFFVMMIAFTDFERARLTDFLGALKGAMSLTEDLLGRTPAEALPDGQDTPVLLSAQDVALIGRYAPAVAQLYEDARLRPHLYVRVGDDGVAILVRAEALFDAKAIALDPGNEAFLQSVGALAADLDNEMRVTAVAPADAAYDPSAARTLWGFCAKRAWAVKAGLMRTAGLPSDRLGVSAHVAGAGEGLLLDGETAPLTEYVEIQVVARRPVRETAPNEIVIRDRWR